VISSKRISHGYVPYQHQQKVELELANQDSCEKVQNNLQIYNKVHEKSFNSPVKQTPQQIEKTYKRKNTELVSKNSRIEEERSKKSKKTKVLDEEEDHPNLQEEITPMDKGPTMIVDVSSSENPKST